jgi:hypothetical protein
MVCEHRRYSLGDKDGRDVAKETVRKSISYKESWEEDVGHRWAKYDFNNPQDLWDAVQACSDIESMPLYLYDHSGITMSTSKFSCPWDSGQIGFIFIAKKQALDEWGAGGTRFTPAIKAKARACMEAEVEVYDQYIRGDVYRIVVIDPDGEEIENCSGFYGFDYAKQEAEGIAKHHMEVVNGNQAAASSSSAVEGQTPAQA